MANPEHVAILNQGADVWNAWREENPGVRPDLSGVDVRKLDLSRINLKDTNLMYAVLRQTYFDDANLSNSDLRHADLYSAILDGADLRDANLSNANLGEADLILSNLSGANLTNAYLGEANLNLAIMHGANLTQADIELSSLVKTDLTGARLIGCRIYGISAWSLKLEDAIQSDLIVTQGHEPTITVDNLEVAQFIYLLINNQKLRDVIGTVGKKAVLILGRFEPNSRKEILDALRDKLRMAGLIPIVFDFEKATNRDFTETIKVLAGMSLFVIADITNPKSSPLELQATVPDYMIPFVPIIQKGEDPFSMFVNLQNKFRWAMDVRQYDDKNHLIQHFEKGILQPAIEKNKELLIQKNEQLKIAPIDQF